MIVKQAARGKFAFTAFRMSSGSSGSAPFALREPTMEQALHENPFTISLADVRCDGSLFRAYSASAKTRCLIAQAQRVNQSLHRRERRG
jgi:hypothetical protein